MRSTLVARVARPALVVLDLSWRRRVPALLRRGLSIARWPLSLLLARVDGREDRRGRGVARARWRSVTSTRMSRGRRTAVSSPLRSLRLLRRWLLRWGRRNVGRVATVAVVLIAGGVVSTCALGVMRFLGRRIGIGTGRLGARESASSGSVRRTIV